MAQRKFRDIVPFNVRMQPGLKKSLEDATRGKVKWSLNAEINERLEASFAEKRTLADYTDGDLIDELIRRWGRDQVLIRLGKE